MKCIVNNQLVLSRPPEGPLAAQIGSFAKSVSEQGYSLLSIHRQVLLAACFSRWLKQKGVGLRSICSDHPVRYLRYRARHVRPCRGDAAALRHLIGFLRREGVIPGERKLACQPTPVEHCAQAFG
jgi:integrase/recombinase XerD